MTTFAQLDVQHVKGNAPAPNQGLSDGAKDEGWFLARKTALTPMLPVQAGPEGIVVSTQEGDYPLPAGWEGYIAVDQAGFPYPIAADEFGATYEQVL